MPQERMQNYDPELECLNGAAFTRESLETSDDDRRAAALRVWLEAHGQGAQLLRRPRVGEAQAQVRQGARFVGL